MPPDAEPLYRQAHLRPHAVSARKLGWRAAGARCIRIANGVHTRDYSEFSEFMEFSKFMEFMEFSRFMEFRRFIGEA
jgi:hypothetical protein